MKTTKMLAILVLALGLTAEVANADFTFGTPTNLPNVNSSAQEFAPEISADEFELYLMSDRPCGYSQEPSEGKIPLTVAAVCMNAKTDTAANIETFTSYISEASEKGARLIVFPEITLQQNPAWGPSSYQPSDEELRYVRETAETIPGPSTEAIVRIARQYDIAVVFGMTENGLDGHLYNASVFLGPNGIFGKYRKRNLADSSVGMNEHLFYKPGSESGLIDSPLGRVGLLVCADMLTQFGPELVAHWKLDETEGSIAYDSAGVNDGILNGEPLWQPTGGIVDGALAFDGIDDYVNTPFVLNPADGKFSVFVWIKGGAPGQVAISQTGGVNWICADTLEGNLMTELKGTGRGGTELLSQTIITDGNWHRIGLVWDGSHRTLYVDGVAVAEDTQANLEGSENGLYIGAGMAMEPGSFWSGLIDDVRIYRRAIIP